MRSSTKRKRGKDVKQSNPQFKQEEGNSKAKPATERKGRYRGGNKEKLLKQKAENLDLVEKQRSILQRTTENIEKSELFITFFSKSMALASLFATLV